MWRIIWEYRREAVIAVVLFSVPFILPLYDIGTDVGILTGATSTIFAIFAGFLIADAMSNYLRLQSLIAEENSSLITIADDAEQIDKQGFKAVHQAIDDYMIAQLDLNTLNHFPQTQRQMDQLHTSIHRLNVAPEDGVLHDHILTMEEKIVNARQEMSLASKKTLTTIHWVTLIALAVLVMFSVLPIRNGEMLTNVFAGLIILGTEAVLIILRDMDNNALLERKLSYENPREVFHAIARPPYYPLSSSTQSRVPDQDGNLRVGSPMVINK